MRGRLPHLLLTLIIFVVSVSAMAQNNADTLSTSSLSKYVSTVEKKINQTDQQVSALTERAITKLEKQEQKLYKKLYKIDSLAAKNIFSQKINHYKQAQQQIESKVQQVSNGFSGEYIPYLDTLTNSIAFLKEGKQVLNQSKEITEKVKAVSDKVAAFNKGVEQTEQMKQYIRERKEFLKQQLGKYTSLSKDLTKLNKTVFYYSQQVKEVKEALKDPKKAEEKVLSLLKENKFFQDFMAKNSFLAGIFNIPADYGTSAIGNLQTRGQVTQFIQTRMTSMGVNAQQQMQQNIHAAQQELHKMKEKFPFLNNTAEMPEFKKVNEERTKTFLNRFEYGANIQLKKAQSVWPATSDIGLQLGYKINQNSTASFGMAYKLGLGSSIDNIRLSSQGMGLRFILDWKIKNGFYINGGYEQNYNSVFQNIEALKNKSAWQYSGLAGLSRKFIAGKKINGSILLLYDFMYKQHVPQTQAFIFRTIYTKR